MSSLLKNLLTIGAGCAAGICIRHISDYKEAFSIGSFTVYYPYRLKTNIDEETKYEKK